MHRKQSTEDIATAFCGYKHPRFILNDLSEASKAFKPFKLCADLPTNLDPLFASNERTLDGHREWSFDSDGLALLYC
jgi:hypothetical protein